MLHIVKREIKHSLDCFCLSASYVIIKCAFGALCDSVISKQGSNIAVTQRLLLE